jgi:methanogenic corrinoid protein MtbC1
MEELLERIAYCVEFGKINLASPYPPDMKGQEGADELTKKALEAGVKPDDILKKGLVLGMEKIGVKFRENKVFVPQVLMSAKSMSTAMEHLIPFFTSGEVKRKGIFVIGTVSGDLHDIGKNLVSMMVEGSGYEVVDLGTDVGAQKFIEAIKQHPNCFVGLSALLTTTMKNMEEIVKDIKAEQPATQIMIGGAPVSEEFKETIRADFYSPDPQGAVDFLNEALA